jgi:hypothetical protein
MIMRTEMYRGPASEALAVSTSRRLCSVNGRASGHTRNAELRGGWKSELVAPDRQLIFTSRLTSKSRFVGTQKLRPIEKTNPKLTPV